MENIIGNNLKKLRKKYGLDQKQLAEKAGVSLSFVRRVEQGKGDLKLGTINKVFRILGYTMYPIKFKDFEEYESR